MIEQRKVIVEPAGTAFRTMDETGQIDEHPTAASVIAWVRLVDRNAARAGRSTATTIEWRGMPDGFEPPEARP